MIHSKLCILNGLDSVKLSELGEPMLKNQFISTGTCTKATPFIPNTNIVADFGLLGKVEINYN